MVDAGRTVSLKTISVTTDTPGYTAEIEAGSSPAGPFAADSSAKTIGSRTTFTLDGKSARYYVVWITHLTVSGVAHVNEVKGTG